MTITATDNKSGLSHSRTGVVAIAKTGDLVEWKIGDPIYAPRNCPALECSELFRIGSWWYLLYSTFDGHTQYRMSKNQNGPWICPAQPYFDMSEAFFYAAKTLWDGKRRLIFGWCGTLYDGKDAKKAQWGGDFVSAREIYQLEGGELAIRCPEEYLSGLKKEQLKPAQQLGSWKTENNVYISKEECGFSALQFTDTSGDWVLKAEFRPNHQHGQIGIAFHCHKDFEDCYLAGMDLGQNSFKIAKFHSGESFPSGGFPELTKILAEQGLGKNQINRILVLKKADILEIFLQDKFVFTIRIADLPDGNLALFTEDTGADFSNITFYRYS
jgi:beta-fructofuranosidase